MAYGGRAKAATRSISTALVLAAATKKERILCTREIQRSIKNSAHKVLGDTIERLGIGGFRINHENIIHDPTGSEFIFMGLHSNREEIKGLEGITKTWIGEARSTSQESIDYLFPTVLREPGAEIWMDHNPDQEDDPIHQMFVVDGRENAAVEYISWRDNPWFPEAMREEMEYDKRVDYDKYLWKWEGECRTVSDAQVFNGKFREEEFDIEDFGELDGGPYYGADWGFSVDPTTLVRAFIKDQKLYIDYEAYSIGADLDATGRMFDEVPGTRQQTITADSARPETIYEMNNRGFYVKPSKKGAGSVEDGIAHLRSYKQIVIHPRCRHTLEEFKLYSYKTDKLTGYPTPNLEDKHNHCIDALRYALEDVSRSVSVAFI